MKKIVTALLTALCLFAGGASTVLAKEGKLIVYLLVSIDGKETTHKKWEGTNDSWRENQRMIIDHTRGEFTTEKISLDKIKVTAAKIRSGRCGFLYIVTKKNGDLDYKLASVYKDRGSAEKARQEKDRWPDTSAQSVECAI